MANSKPSAKSLKAKCDKLASQVCRSIGKCEAAGEGPCGGGLEWCHLVSRGVLRIRYAPENCVCMCHIHHKHFTMYPAAFVRFIEKKYPGRWDDLHYRAKHDPKVDYEAVIEELNKRAA